MIELRARVAPLSLPPTQEQRLSSPVPQEGDFSASRRDELLLRYEDVLENVASRRMRHVDTRPADQFPGDDKGRYE